MIVGSGNIVHNLQMLNPSGPPFDWALEFDALVTKYLNTDDSKSLSDFATLGRVARVAHPTHDHYLPALYVQGLRRANDEIQAITDKHVADIDKMLAQKESELMEI